VETVNSFVVPKFEDLLRGSPFHDAVSRLPIASEVHHFTTPFPGYHFETFSRQQAWLGSRRVALTNRDKSKRANSSLFIVRLSAHPCGDDALSTSITHHWSLACNAISNPHVPSQRVDAAWPGRKSATRILHRRAIGFVQVVDTCFDVSSQAWARVCE
jgi:hypothetical protein